MEHHSHNILRRTLALLAGTIAMFAATLAGAQGSFVQIYGSFNAGFEYAAREGATASTTALNSLTPAIFQLESFIFLDTGNGNLGGRNSNVGLQSNDWGTVFYGIWDTPFKLTTVRLDAFNVWDANY